MTKQTLSRQQIDDIEAVINAASHLGADIDPETARVLVDEVRRLQQQRKYLLAQLAKRDAESGSGDAALREFLAGEEEASTPASGPDTLPAWLHWRFGPHGQPWSDVPAEDQACWEHQARAVRRAVARGGFKAAPAPAVPAGDGQQQ